MDLLASFGVGSVAGLINLFIKARTASQEAELKRDKDYLEIAKMEFELWRMRMEVISGNKLLLMSEIFSKAWFMIVPTLVLVAVTYYSTVNPDTTVWFPDENSENSLSVLGFEIFSWSGPQKWSQLQGTVIFPIWFTMLGAAVSMSASDRMFKNK